jgi:hypothetical protein
MTWEEALRYASGEGIAILVAAFLSIAADYSTRYNNLEPKKKQIVYFALSMVVPLAAAILGVLTEDWALSWEVTFWPAVRNGLAAAGFGTMLHRTKEPVKRVARNVISATLAIIQ